MKTLLSAALLGFAVTVACGQATPQLQVTSTPAPTAIPWQSFDPGEGWERVSFEDGTCNDEPCDTWIYDDEKLLMLVGDDHIAFTIRKEAGASVTWVIAATVFGVPKTTILGSVDAFGNGDFDNPYTLEGWRFMLGDHGDSWVVSFIRDS